MAIRLKQLMKNLALWESTTGKENKRRASDVRDDRCHEMIGDLIEKHPIVSGRVRRG